MDFAQRLTKLMEINNVTTYRMSKDTGIPDTTICRWKNGVAMPSQKKKSSV